MQIICVLPGICTVGIMALRRPIPQLYILLSTFKTIERLNMYLGSSMKMYVNMIFTYTCVSKL